MAESNHSRTNRDDPAGAHTGLIATSVTEEHLPITFGTLTLADAAAQSIVSIAFSAAELPALSNALQRAWSLELPPVGAWCDADQQRARLLRLQQDLCFVLLPETTQMPVEQVGAALEGVGRLTDQSDSWLPVTLLGAEANAALERLCMLDLHPDCFSERSVSRTVMEHLAVILYRDVWPASSDTEAQGFTLYSPRSSAQSFLHALTTAMRSVAPDAPR